MTAEPELPPQQPFCKPLLHRMVVSHNDNFPQAAIPHLHYGITAPCHLHAANPSPLRHDDNICPVHHRMRTYTDSPQKSMVTQSFSDERSSVACSASITDETHLHFENHDFTDEEIGDVKSFHGSWSAQQPEEDLKKACEKLCEQIQWEPEKHYQEVARSSFQEIVQCQAALHALHEESVFERSRSDFRVGPSKQDLIRDTLSLGQSHSSFSDVTFARPFRECCKERPMSAPRITSSGRRSSLVPEDLLQRYSVKGVNAVTCKGVTPREVVPLHPSPRSDRFRSKSVDRKKPRFCTGINRGKGEMIVPEDHHAPKKMLNVLPVIMLHRDKTKGVWNRTANQKEWDHGHRGCCSQHWVSVLDNNEKVIHADGRKSLCARASLSPTPKGKFAVMATQKLKVPGQRCRPQVARSLDLSSSPLSSLKAIVKDMSRPQSASLPKRSNSVSTPRSASTCKRGQKPSIAVTPARKLNNPKLNSSAWLLAKMEALRNETFTEPKALQIAKEHGIVLDKEDEAALKKFLQPEQSPRLDRALDAAERERNKTREKYFDLSNIRLAESAVAARKLKKQLSPKAHAAGIRECCKNSTSDLLVASDRCSQVSLKPGDLNLKHPADGPVFSDDVNVWIERCREAHTNMNANSSC